MTLRTGIMLSIAAVLGATAIVVTWLFLAGLTRYGDETARSAVQTRSNALAAFVSRSLYEQWQSIEQQAARLSPSAGPDVLQAAVESLAAGNPKASWVGIARANGTVVAASSGLLVGENVASRPWFGEGLKGAFAGDVHEAVLLARLLGSESSEPLRFIDFSAPIRNPDGSVWGVLGAHVNWRWVRELVAQAAEQLALDAFIVNAAGTVILSTGTAAESIQDLAVFRSAALGQPASSDEVWPDGKPYYAVTLGEPSYDTLPPFGWRYVLRLDPALIHRAADRFSTEFLLGVAMTLALSLLVIALLVGFFTRPLRGLSEALLQLSRGESVGYHRERTRYRELSMLSDALAGLQSQALSNRPGNDPPQ
jgi:hypothetical protein